MDRMKKKLEIVFIDMDGTVLEHDCDVLWKYFLVEKGLAPDSSLEMANYYLELYDKGKTPVKGYIEFQLKEFVGNTPEKMRSPWGG